jgi:hypothetical protein
LTAIRYLAVFIGGMVAGSRVVQAVRAWQEWHRRIASDPSGADAYRTFSLMSAAEALVILCLAALLWHLLRPRTIVSGPR